MRKGGLVVSANFLIACSINNILILVCFATSIIKIFITTVPFCSLSSRSISLRVLVFSARKVLAETARSAILISFATRIHSNDKSDF